MSNDSDPLMFLNLFLILAVCSLLALVVTASVSDPTLDLDTTKDPGLEATKDPDLEAINHPGLEASKEKIRMRQTRDIESEEINNNSES